MKTRSVSLTVKVNILILVITLAISLSLIAISDRNYRKAILDPYTQKLTGAKIDPEELIPVMANFIQYFGTQELQDILKTGGTDPEELIEWMEQKPSSSANNSASESENLVYDWIAIDMSLNQLMNTIDLDIACAEVMKDNTVYRIAYCEKQSGGYTSAEDFWVEEPFISFGPDEFTDPLLVEAGGVYQLAHCIQYELDGGIGRLWLAYDMTEAVREHRRFVLNSILYVLILTLAFSVVSVFLLDRYVTRPIRILAQSATEFKAGEDGIYSPDKISRARIRSRDELGDLSREIHSMQSRIVNDAEKLTRMTIEKERINTELNMAMQIQKSMLPSTSQPFPGRTDFEICATMTPAREVGGDFYDFFLVDDRHLCVAIADVSGKGIPAALFMMASKITLSNLIKSGKSPAQVLADANTSICANNPKEMFVTVWLGILDLSSGKLTCANAGHEYPMLRKPGEFYQLIKTKHGFVLGGMNGMKYQEHEIQMEPGSSLFLYTDGLTEAVNADNQMFGTNRVLDHLNTACADSPEETLSDMKEAVEAYVQGLEAFDDLTMLCITYYGPAKDR